MSGEAVAQETAAALVRDGLENEYALHEAHDAAWIRVGSISIHVRRHPAGVAVDLYPYEAEDEEPIGSTWAMFSDAERDAVDGD